jgi:hypothetical protein
MCRHEFLEFFLALLLLHTKVCELIHLGPQVRNDGAIS